MYGLGISAFYHDSAACLLKDGEIIAALEEERFSRIKHDNAFPARAIRECLRIGGISASDLSWIAYYEKPLRKFERIIDQFAATFPFSWRTFVEALPDAIAKLDVERRIRKEAGFAGDIFFFPHHYSHAAAAYFSSRFNSAAILTIDGVGEYQTTAIWKARGSAIELVESIEYPSSLGLFYSTLTAFLGFRVNSDEFQVMALAALGKPRFKDALVNTIALEPDGSFALDMRYFAFDRSARMWSKKLETLLGAPRMPHEPIDERHKDIAASVQAIAEDAYLALVRRAREKANERTLCIGGGFALNATGNGKVVSSGIFEQVHIFGPAGDSGAALGAALATYFVQEKSPQRHPIDSLALGTAYGDDEIERALKNAGVSYKKLSESELIEKVATLLAKNHVIGWFQGRMEFGPRALGNRSILASPKGAEMKKRINAIKNRRDFRPFGSVILGERAAEYFEMPTPPFPYMNICFPVRKERTDTISAVLHVDGSSRVQTISKSDGRVRTLLEAFDHAAGVPLLLNTSFNAKDEPIVESPEQAIQAFKKLGLDALAIGNFLIERAA